MSFNIQNLKKSRGYLECLKAREGHVLIQADTEAVEPTVLTEFSKDWNLMKIYGPDAVPNQDIYLFVGSHTRKWGAPIRQYYDPDHPTKEGKDAAKKNLKKDRGIIKGSHLACSYNAFPRRIHKQWMLSGVDLPFQDAVDFHADWWRTFPGVADFKQRLETEWANRGGWVLNGTGRPIAVAEDKTKDLLNRFCQSTGHDILMKILWHVERLRTERGVEMYPWIADYHDELIFECRTELTEPALAVCRDAVTAVNEGLNGSVPIRAVPMAAENLAQIKCED